MSSLDSQKNPKDGDLYHHRVVKLVESYYENKYENLEAKRERHQTEFEREQAYEFNSRDMQYHLGDEAINKNTMDPYSSYLPSNDRQQQINIDSLLGDGIGVPRRAAPDGRHQDLSIQNRPSLGPVPHGFNSMPIRNAATGAQDNLGNRADEATPYMQTSIG